MNNSSTCWLEGVNTLQDTNRAPAGEISRLAEHLFRHESGKLVSVLTGIFGIDRLHFAEDVVQEALVRALQTWPYLWDPKKSGRLDHANSQESGLGFDSAGKIVPRQTAGDIGIR